MAVITHCAGTNRSTNAPFKRRVFILVGALTLLVSAILSPTTAPQEAHPQTRYSEFVEHFGLFVDESCSPFSSLLSCIEVTRLGTGNAP